MNTASPPAVHELDHHVTGLAGWIDPFLAAALIAGPVGFVIFTGTQALAVSGHTASACLWLGAVVIAGLMVVMAGQGWHRRPRPRRQSASVRRINRQAARRLIPAALLLATVVALAATKPVVLAILGAVLVLYVAPAIAAAWLTLRITRRSA
jgi:hypothetical protein